MPLINLPDGNQLDLPDDASPEMREAVRQKLATSYQTATPGQKLWDAVKDVGRNIQSGATDFVRGAGNALAGLMEGAGEFNAAERGPLRNSGPSGLTKLPEELLPIPQGDSQSRQYVRAGLEGLGGAVATGGTGLVNAVSGVGSGVGGKMAEDWAPGNTLAHFAGNVVGGLATGLPTGMVSRVRPQTAAVAKEAIEGLTPEQLNTAQLYKNDLATKGIEIDLAQALKATNGHSGNLESIRNFLAGHSRGDKVQATLRSQPEALATNSEITVEGMPGKNYSAIQNANNVQQTATQTIENAKKARTELWEQTVKDGVAALKASEGIKVGAAKDFFDQTGLSVGQARAQVNTLVAELAAAKTGDAKAVAALNQKLADKQQLIADLKEFSLPRGNTTTNAGSYSTLPQRGQSIIYDSMGREVKRDGLINGVTPPIEPAPSLETLTKQRDLAAAQRALGQTQQQHDLASAALRKAQQGYNATESVPPSVLSGAQQKIQAVIDARPNSVEAAELSGLLSKLQTPQGPITDPLAINRILVQFTTRLKSPDLKTQGMDAGVSKFLGGVVDNLRADLGQGFSPIRAANDAFRNNTETVINPLRQGPVGALAQPHGYDPATAATVSKFEGLMNKGSDPKAAVSDIRTAAKELATTDPTSFESAFKGWLSRKVQSATTASGGGSALPTTDPVELAKKLFNDPLQWQGIKDATAEMARIRGVSPDEMIRGLENLRQLTTAMGSRAPVGGISPNDLRELGGNSAIADAARMGGMMGNNQAGRFLERKTFGTTLSKLDEILTSPEGAALLVKLSKVPVMSNKAQWLIGTWAGGAANPPGLRSDNPPE